MIPCAEPGGISGMPTQRIGGHETTHRGGVEAGAEVIKPGLAIAFFAGEFVLSVGCRGLDEALAAERVVVGNVPLALVTVEETSIPEMVVSECRDLEVAAVPFPAGYADSIKIVIAVLQARSVESRFGEGRCTSAVPVECAVRFVYTLAVAIILVCKYSFTAAASTRTFPDPAQWRSSPFFFTPETQNDSPVSIST